MSAVEVLPPGLTGPDHPEWFEARRTGITASEIAVVLGLSPYDSPFALYWRKKGALAEQPDDPAMRWGRRLESHLADEFADRHPEYDLDSAGLYAHPARPWQLATPDRLLWEWQHTGMRGDLLTALECKTTGSWDGWGEEGTDEIPVHYRAQVLWQADVLGVAGVHVAVANGRAYREYWVPHDPDECAFMRAKATAFITDLAHDNPPPVDGTQPTITALKQLHPDLDDTEAKVPDGLAQQWRRTLRAYRAAEDRKKRLEAELRQRMGRARHAVDPAGDRIATRVIYERKPYQVGPSTVDSLRPAKETA